MKKTYKFLVGVVLFAIIVAFANLFAKILSYDTNPLNIETEFINTSEITSEVNLISNEIYNPTDNYYLSQYIDNIDYMFEYSYESDYVQNIEFDIEIYTTLELSYSKSGSADNYEISTFKDTLINYSEVSNEQEFSFDYEYNINLEDYLQIIEEFSENVSIPIVGTLNIYFIVNAYDEDNNIVLDNYKNSVAIDLTEDVYFVDDSSEMSDTVKTYFEIKEYTLFQKIIAMVVFLLSVIFFMVYIKIFFFKEKSSFEKTIKKIITLNDDVVVNVENMINSSNYEIIYIKEFKELLNLEREKSTPIFFYRTKSQAKFYIIEENILYLYVLKKSNK